MTSSNLLDNLISFLNCFDPKDFINDRPNSNNSDNLNEKNLRYHEAENIAVCSNTNKMMIDLNRSFSVHTSIERNSEDLFDFQDEKYSQRKEEQHITEEIKEKDKNIDYQQTIKESELFVFFQKIPPEEIDDENLTKLLLKSSLITEEENKLIHFSKKGLMIFYQNLMLNQEFKQFYDKNNLKLSYKKDGTSLSQNFILGKAIYKLNKNVLNPCIKLDNIIELLYDFDVRKSWDQSIKDIIILEKDEDSTTFNMIINSPNFLISDRDVLDKKIEFYHNGIYYNFNSSINDFQEQQNKGVVRCRTYLNIFIITQDEEYFYFLGLSQLDIKMPFPDSLINMILAPKLLSFYNDMITELNKRYK